MKKLPIVILYVSDQTISSQFYQNILNREPILNVPGMTEFMLSDSMKLGIMPENGIAKIICPITLHPKLGKGIPRCELYLIVENPEEALKNAVRFGAIEISKAQTRDWGDFVSYCSDPDGHILAFAK